MRLMNTVWADTGGLHDALTDPTALRDWLADVTEYDRRELGRPSRRDVNDALLLRNSLRRVAAFCTADNRPTAQSPIENVSRAIEVINVLAADRPRTELALEGGALSAVTAQLTSPTRSALAVLAHQGIELLAGPDVINLRPCYAPHCVLYFVKSNPRREWCSEMCGNRVRAARHYERTRGRKQR